MPRALSQFINRILCGDACQILKQLPGNSIDCVVTSPPYWALRDYGVSGQLGLELTVQEYIAKLCTVFDEIKRVLKPEGTCWVNMGDTYSTRNSSKGKWNLYLQPTNLHIGSDIAGSKRPGTNLTIKCLLQIPSRFAIEMINRGWILRNEIIWWKPNAIPDSARDRFSVDFEKIYFFVKQPVYWFDLDSVREPQGQKQIAEGMRQAKRLGYSGRTSYQDWYFHERKKTSWVDAKKGRAIGKGAARGMPKTKLVHPLGRTRRCVWSIPTKPSSREHSAVYPPQLIHTPIKAGCPKGGVVLDPFVGSGTTALVARDLKRNFIGIDLNPSYVQMSERRLA